MSDSSLDSDDSNDVDVKHDVERLQWQLSNLQRRQANLKRTLSAKDEEIRKLKQDAHTKDNDVTAMLKSNHETIDTLRRRLSSFIPQRPPPLENHYTTGGKKADDFERQEAQLGNLAYGRMLAAPPVLPETEEPPRQRRKRRREEVDAASSPGWDRGLRNMFATGSGKAPYDLTPEEMYALGEAYTYSRSLKGSVAAAKKWYTRAAEAGNVSAMLKLGHI